MIESHKQGLRGTVQLTSMVELEDAVAKPTILTARFTADVVEDVKVKMLNEIKKRAQELTVDSIKLEEITIPHYEQTENLS